MARLSAIALVIGIVLIVSLAFNFALFTTPIGGQGGKPIATVTTTAVSTLTEVRMVTATQSQSSSPSNGESSAVYTTSPQGLELQIRLNTTSIPAGGALVAQIDLVNTLNQNLSLTPDWSDSSQIESWAYQENICGSSNVDNTFGFALYKGDYTAANLSDAGTPLTLLPPSANAVFCPNSGLLQEYIRNIQFSPDSYLATFSANASFANMYKAQVITMELNATTGGCQTKSNGEEIVTVGNNVTTSTYSTEGFYAQCGPGPSLYGYWTAPANNQCSETPSENASAIAASELSCNFRSFTAGTYTIVAEDIWNQTIYSYFQVTPLPTPVKIVSVIGPISPYNPGGPVINIVLTNVASLPIDSLTAKLQLESQSNTYYTFSFGVNSSNPLTPGQSTEHTQTLMGAGFDSTQSYPLVISGVLSNGTQFSFTQNVQIASPN